MQAPTHCYLFLLGGPLQRQYARTRIVAPILTYSAAGPAARWSPWVQAAGALLAAWVARCLQYRSARHYYRRLGVPLAAT